MFTRKQISYNSKLCKRVADKNHLGLMADLKQGVLRKTVKPGPNKLYTVPPILFSTTLKVSRDGLHP